MIGRHRWPSSTVAMLYTQACLLFPPAAGSLGNDKARDEHLNPGDATDAARQQLRRFIDAAMLGRSSETAQATWRYVWQILLPAGWRFQ
jgi:hypothetical protein